MANEKPPVELDLSPGSQDFLTLAHNYDRARDKHVYTIEVRSPDRAPIYKISSDKVKDRVSLAVLIAQEMAKDLHFGFGRDQKPYRWIGNRWASVEKWLASIDYSMHVLARTALNSRDTSLTAEAMAAWHANSKYSSDGLDLRAFGECPGIPFEDCVLEFQIPSSPEGPQRPKQVPHRPENLNLRVLPLNYHEVQAMFKRVPRPGVVQWADLDLPTATEEEVANAALNSHRFIHEDSMLWRFLTSTLEAGQLNQLMRWFGFHLVANKFPNPEKMVYLWGDGGNGKSQILWLLRGLVGADACAELRLYDIKHSANVELLVGKLAMIGSEANTVTELDTLKRLVSREPLNVNPKYRDPYTLTPDCLVTQASNHAPRFNEKSDAMVRRVVSLHLKKSFAKAEDKVEDIAKKILEEEYPQLVAFALRGVLDIITEGGFKVEEEVQRESEAKVAEGNPFEVFAELLEFGPFEVAHTELHRYYLHWCRTAGGKINAVGLKELLDHLERIAGKADRKTKRDSRSVGYKPSLWYEPGYPDERPIAPELQKAEKPAVIRGFRIKSLDGICIGQPIPESARDRHLFTSV